MGKNSKSKNKKETPIIQEHIRKKIHFSFEYFNYDGIQETTNENLLRKTLLKMKQISTFTARELITNKDLKLLRVEKSEKTIKIAKRIINNDNYFIETCGKTVYDLFWDNFPLRVFGIIDHQKHCFNILMFDPIHDSR